MGRRWIGVLAVSALLLLADVGDAKKEKKKKKKFFKEADLMCSACEEMVERVEWNLKDIRKKDEVAITEAMDGLCDNMTMYAFSKDFPRKFLRATGHAMETPDEHLQSHPNKSPGMAGANAIKVVKADVMHDQKADKKIMRFCQQYVDKEKYEDELVDAIRYADPGISIQREFCYSHHKECKTRDIEGGQLVAPVLKTFKKVVEFMSVAKDGEVASKLIFFPDPNEGDLDEDGEGDVGELEQYVMMAAQAQDQVKYAIVRDPKVIAKMEATADAQYATPSVHLFRRLDKQNLTMPLEDLEKMTTPQPLLEWAQTSSFPELPDAMLYQVEGMAMSETYGTRKVFPQVIFFVEVNKPAHKELIDNFAAAIKELEEENGGKLIIPSLVDIGRKTRKEYEADIADRYQVKRTQGPQVRGFRRDIRTQTFGSRLQGMPPKTEMTKQNLKEYTKAILEGKVPALGPKSEDDPEGTEQEQIDGVRKVVGKTFNKIVLAEDKLMVLSTFGAPCPDCQWSQPPFAVLAKKYQHMNDTITFGMMNTVENEVNGIPNAMQTQMWIFGPGSKTPNKYEPERGYNVENLEEWIMSGASDFGITLVEAPKVELPPDDEDPVAPEKPEKSEQELAVEAAVKADDLSALLDAVGVDETKFTEEGFEKISNLVESQVSDKDLKTGLGVKKLKARKAILRAIAMMAEGKDEL